MNRKGISWPIIVLFFLGLGLTSMTYIYLNSLDEKIDATTDLHKSLNEVYIKKDLINFYTKNIFEKSVGENLGDKSFLVDNFMSELKKYKDKENNYPLEELNQLEFISEENFDITDNSVIFRINLRIEKDDLDIKVVYSYEEKFEKVFK